MERKTKSIKQSPGQVLEGVLKAWRISKTELEQKLNLSQPTLLKRIRNPELITGAQRKELAMALNLGVEVIDDLVNGKFDSAEQFVDELSVPPIKK